MARDANGEVWVERGGQLSALNPHWKVRFDALGEDAPGIARLVAVLLRRSRAPGSCWGAPPPCRRASGWPVARVQPLLPGHRIPFRRPLESKSGSSGLATGPDAGMWDNRSPVAHR